MKQKKKERGTAWTKARKSEITVTHVHRILCI